MNQSPDISVIVLTYNQQDTIARTIDSILSQQLPDGKSLEIVVSDDASTDSTRQIVEQMAAERPDVVRLLPGAPNKGVVTNYFSTLAQCRGRYITDCSGDDFMTDPLRLATQMELLDSDSDLIMVLTRFSKYEISTGTLIPSPLPKGHELTIINGAELLTPLLAHAPVNEIGPIHLSTALLRADSVKRALAKEGDMIFNPDFGCEDLPLLAALFAGAGAAQRDNNRVALLPRDTMAYSVMNPAQITASSPTPRAAIYYASTLRATAILARHYGVDFGSLYPYFRRVSAHAARLALRSRSRRATDILQSTLREFPQIKVSPATRLLVMTGHL
ncbi:MAG: glycosyltransferase family 2 protein, partial [Paramuribaculum sp.]|nr:glycosyltransferase family 2 protein [Paramuribaculum sp.]